MYKNTLSRTKNEKKRKRKREKEILFLNEIKACV